METDKLIITQLPFPITLVDFWSLVWDYTCTSVVVLNQLQELDEVSSPHAPLPSPSSSGAGQCSSHTALLLLAAGAHCKLVGSTWESPEDSPSTMALQWWDVPSITAREHPSGFS